MFKPEGGLSAYLYRQDKESRFGTTDLASDFRFERGRYQAVSIQVKLNDPPEEANGSAAVFVDGELVVRAREVRFRSAGGPGSQISMFLFSTFHGGGSPPFAPRDAAGDYTTLQAYFDNFAIHRGEHLRAKPGS